MSDHHHHEHGPDCGHEHGHGHAPKGQGKPLLLAAAIAAVVGVGAFLISKLGEKSEKTTALTPPDGTWQARIEADQPVDKSR